MKVIAHRGYSAHYMENTLLAFEKAIEAGVDMIETDIRLTADAVPVIFHDDTLKRLCGQTGSVESCTFKQLPPLKPLAGKITESSAVPIPTLQSLLEQAQNRSALILEIKDRTHAPQLIASVIGELVKDKTAWVEISSFNDKILRAFHESFPNITLHQLLSDPKDLEREAFEAFYDYADVFDVDIALLDHPKTRELLQKRRVIFWTVEDEEPVQFSQAYAAMSNDPLKLKKMLNAF